MATHFNTQSHTTRMQRSVFNLTAFSLDSKRLVFWAGVTIYVAGCVMKCLVEVRSLAREALRVCSPCILNERAGGDSAINSAATSVAHTRGWPAEKPPHSHSWTLERTVNYGPAFSHLYVLYYELHNAWEWPQLQRAVIHYAVGDCGTHEPYFSDHICNFFGRNS